MQSGTVAGALGGAGRGLKLSHLVSTGNETDVDTAELIDWFVDRPDVKVICLNCHEKDAAKPAFLPQVMKADHYTDVLCSECHQPHNPKM